MNEPVIIIVGNVGKEPEMRFTPEGKAITNFSVALYTGGSKDKGYKDPVWVRISAWDELAEEVNNTITKGMKVRVSGIPQPPRTYEKDGETRSAGLEVTAQKVEQVEREG